MPGAAWAVATPPAAVKLRTASAAGAEATNERISRDAVIGHIFPQRVCEISFGCGRQCRPREVVGASCHTGGVVTWPEENELADIDDRPMVRLVAHCRRCHGWLLSPQSVAQGIGPTCAIRERAESRARSARELTLFDVAA
ncbi:DUF6011 domain-containing protein [Nocardia beijingensis]